MNRRMPSRLRRKLAQSAEVERGLPRFEQRLLLRYALCAMETRRGVPPPLALLEWAVEHADLFGAPAPELDESDEQPRRRRGQSVSREVWSRFAPLIAAGRRTRRAAAPSPLELRLRWLGETLGLNERDNLLLGLTVRLTQSRDFGDLLSAVEDSNYHGDRVDVAAASLASLSGLSLGAVHAALAPTAPLRLLGLVEDHHGDEYAPSSAVVRVARQQGANPRRLEGVLLGESRRAQLAWCDFDHLGEAADLTERLLAAALDRGETGVNLLLHGEPGTGKTEFVRTLAARLGARALFVGEADDDREEPTRGARIAAYAVARVLAGRAGRAILVVDEADDVFTAVDFGDGAARKGSKVFMNRLVETAEAPTVWITNHPDRLGESVVRRMTLALRFPAPGLAVRRRMVDRIARRRRLKLGGAGAEALAALAVSPAVMDSAVRVARLTGGGAADATRTARGVAEALTGARPPAAPAPPIAFDPALSEADQDLTRLAERVVASGRLDLSFLFSGSSGTGKSAYARWLAERLGLEVVEKRASDLLSMWVGGSEKAIAAAFAEAADARAMLILDEADGLLRDRAGAGRAWEVTQVNEMLTWMERHPWPFACTTNLGETLDPATSRRFLFKVRFSAMTGEQAAAAFRRTWSVEPPTEVGRLHPLTPGDFAVAARKAAVLGVVHARELATMLAEEVGVKPGGGLGRLGF